VVITQNRLLRMPLIAKDRLCTLLPRGKRANHRDYICVQRSVDRFIVLCSWKVQHISRPVNHLIRGSVLATQPQARIQRKNKFCSKLDYNLAPKANRRPSQSFTTNSRDSHGMLAMPRVNSTPRAAYSA